MKDFAGVSRVASVPLVAIVPPDFPAKTLKEFIALAKEKPGKLNFSSAGVASTSFLSAEILRQDAKINMVHVPFKGAPEAMTAVIRDDVQIYFAPIPATQELSATGKVRALAINSAKRVPQLPDVPTVAETLPNYKYESWFGVLAPAGTPQPILTKVSEDIAKVLEMPDVMEKLLAQGSIPGADHARRVRRHQQGRHRALRQDPQGRRHHAAITRIRRSRVGSHAGRLAVLCGQLVGVDFERLTRLGEQARDRLYANANVKNVRLLAVVASEGPALHGSCQSASAGRGLS